MKHFDFIIIGGGIAGLITAFHLKEFKTLLIDEGILNGGSGAAGAFLFPKISKHSSYTNFINDAILESFSFYENIGINTHKNGVLLLPRDEKDIEKFKEYEKYIKLPFEKIKNGFFFKDGGFVEVDEVRKKIEVPFLEGIVKSLKKEKNFWLVNNEFYAKNIILATGYKEFLKIPYINIRPIWGERIEISGIWESDLNIYYHKNCSVAEVGEKLRIGATHKRNCLKCHENIEEANELIKKAKEIIDIKKYKIENIKGGFRAASIDYFPIVGKVIDVYKTLRIQPNIVKGELPKEIKYIEGLYIINGMGGRGFSNAVKCAKMLKNYILNKEDLGKIDTKRLFIKWARKEGEKFLRDFKEN